MQRHTKYLLISLTSILLTACATYKKSPDVNNDAFLSENGVRYKFMFCDYSELNYIITFPNNYTPDETNYPLIVFLHSMAERGLDLKKLIHNEKGQGNGLAKFALENNLSEFITISPLCPKGKYWSFITKRLNKLLVSVFNENSIDKDRIYLTGVSMGGMGTWSFAMGFPDWFAAIAPISGGVYKPFMKENVKQIQNIPVWIFHDEFDNEIPIKKTMGIFKKLEKVDANVKITIFKDGEHYLNNRIFDEGLIFNWFLQHSK